MPDRRHRRRRTHPRAWLVLGTLLVGAIRNDALAAPIVHLGAWNHIGCEPPAIFYSANHDPKQVMCCDNVTLPSVGVCPGGDPCPADGTCVIATCGPGTFCPKGNPCPGDGRCLGTCVPATDPINDLPNVVVFTSDDQAACQYGFSEVCRSDLSGIPVPAPYTPSTDSLAHRGKVFPVAHNSGNWCFPSLDTIITGRLPAQGACEAPDCAPPGARFSTDIVGAGVPTIPQLIGVSGPGYCTYQIGKGNGSGCDASRTSHHIGRTPCARCDKRTWSSLGATECQFDPAACPDPDGDPDNPACAGAPLCGEDILPILGGKAKAPSTGEMDFFLQDLVAPGKDGKLYLPKKFFAWLGPHLPHVPASPEDIVEHRPHLSGPVDQSYCKDFLFGYLCSEPAPGVVQVLGPRFPFGAPAYAAAMRGESKKSKMLGTYGMVYWADNMLGRVRKFLASHVVETSSGPASLATNTVIIYLSDNGAYLPRSKKRFTENAYRTALIVYDPRHETAPGGTWKIDDDIAHSVDVLPTVLSYVGVTVPPEMVGKNLRPYLEDASPPKLRNAVCGTDIKSINGTKGRYLLARGGVVGQCSSPTSGPCASDPDCTGVGELCTAGGVCAIPGSKPCIDDDDCHTSPGDTTLCVFQERSWCSSGPIKACTADSDCRAACKTCKLAPSTGCQTDADCNGVWGPCVDAPADKLGCSCGRRLMKIYQSSNGLEFKIADLLRDPDETDLVDGDGMTNALSQLKLGKLAHRLRCCMDEWWLPPGLAPESCPEGCDSRASCL